MRIIFIGPPGSGKGTQAAALSKRLSVAHISTGEMLREEVSAKTPLGLQVKSVLDSGNLVPDSLMLDLIKVRIARSDCTNGFVLDGFPRTLQQAEDLDALLAAVHKELTHILELKVPEAVLLERVKRRATQGATTRSDDNDKVLATRLKVYREQTEPVLNFYRNSGRRYEVDGLGTIDDVQGRIHKVLQG